MPCSSGGKAIIFCTHLKKKKNLLSTSIKIILDCFFFFIFLFFISPSSLSSLSSSHLSISPLKLSGSLSPSHHLSSWPTPSQPKLDPPPPHPCRSLTHRLIYASSEARPSHSHLSLSLTQLIVAPQAPSPTHPKPIADPARRSAQVSSPSPCLSLCCDGVFFFFLNVFPYGFGGCGGGWFWLW